MTFSNMPIDMTDEQIQKIARDAINASATSKRDEASASQTIAYAVMCHRVDMKARGETLTEWSHLASSSKAMNNYAQYIMEWLYGRKPVAGPDADKANHAVDVAERNAQLQAVKRSLSFAATLMSVQIDHTYYKPVARKGKLAVSAFHVPFALLLGPNERGLMVNSDDMVALDNAIHPYLKAGKTFTSLNASVARIRVAADLRAGKVAKAKVVAATTGDDAATGDASGPKISKADMTFGRHLIAAAKILRDGGTVTRDMLASEEWNALADLVAAYDAIQGDDAKPALKVVNG